MLTESATILNTACKCKHSTFTPKISSSWFSRTIKSLQQNSSSVSACQILKAFGHKGLKWCTILIKTSELDFCDMIKARGMQKFLSRLNPGIQHQLCSTPRACLAFPLSLTVPPSPLCPARLPPLAQEHLLSLSLCFACALPTHVPLSASLTCPCPLLLLGTYSLFHGASKDPVVYTEQRGQYTKTDCIACSNLLQWVSTFYKKVQTIQNTGFVYN